MFFNLHIRSSLAHISRQNRNYLFRKETQNPMFAFLIIWIHLKQKQKTDLISDVSLCLRKEKKRKKIEGRKCLGVSILTEVSGFVPHSGDKRTTRKERGPKQLWWATKNSGRTPKQLSWRRKLGKILAQCHVHNDIPIFYSFPFQRRRGWKVLRDRTIEKATASNSKPALCGYSIYIPIYRYMRSILSIYTDYIYSIWNKSSLTGKRLPTVPGRFRWIWS